ncbi:MAG: 30S ribosomal protein S3 [Candidatus Buchananbacteria bacterium RIFCSPHIGHO2_02_FULL_45_11b]|uniref:Small ribosomal subunit protein uS3 n=4 Tax=Candidatus Buchananiibacteriota TaxID=1817903 RepID=A0A1G1YM67_9BACT|nr:MAG: 30S ribosomal protein S3 [Candidatus Buchananbacteria bacterium RIFCSPHIGHO2_01_FULL_46_12]OGY50498.1 MAG: 30S ribosomal protein S3 [Candidatus Buchananbacteria bacterium RIFCSPHIGHO2_02_FULL_45_11b]OGY53452.1 MAG: 30S ribosomal protein S3 [Candidatus Buchananbacteria bacterium RIFCSPLOWO2_01_FULL_45_31]OGY57072.1 MAG: 30S ribosomal protein S3 [Candidatus Buchananbacteria bacterium RIFCSPLOWO2_02_FULL_46_11b]
MGHKVHPKIFRLGELYTWNSKWFARKDYAKFLRQDILIRKFLKKELKDAAIAQIEIERTPAATTVIIYSAKPGVIIGRGGQGIEELKKKIKKNFLDPKSSLNVNIKEIDQPNLCADLIVQSIAADLEKRMPFRRVMKQAIGRVEKAGAKGVKITVSGRLNGAEIARTETLSSGKLPLHTLRADIDYARGAAQTTYGVLGIKVWIYKGEIFKKKENIIKE